MCTPAAADLFAAAFLFTETLNQSSAADGGSFSSIHRYEKLEILRSRWRLCRLTDAACPLRVVSALYRDIQLYKGSDASLHHPDVSLRGGRRPTWQSPATGCVFAEAFLLFTIVLRDSHVASLLGMTNLFALRQ